VDVAALSRAGRFGAGGASFRRDGWAAVRPPADSAAMDVGREVFPPHPEKADCLDFSPRGFNRAFNE
jgi:hypothetical protein